MGEPEVKEDSKYWERIKENIEELYINCRIYENYSYNSFCKDFIPDILPLKISISNNCLCGHDIKHNYKYTHKDNIEEYFILGSCCIKRFSIIYREQRQCKECGEKIRRNDDNLCKDCRDEKKEIIKYQEKCKCKGCGYIKKDDKYKYCYSCKYGQKKYNKCKECGMNKKEDTFLKCYKCNMKNKYNPIEDNIRVALDSWTDK